MKEQFLKRMQTMIPDEYPEFLKSLEEPVLKGVRINPKKVNILDLVDQLNLKGPSQFYPNLYVADLSGLNPYHICGAYYLQEPSAASVVPLLEVQEDDLVLDLCAAPGSKSTQILDFLKDGFLISNEIDPKRAKILLSNMERMGAINFAVTNSDPKMIASTFPLCFDKILVDAPCSGEGMIKKHTEASQQWSQELILQCQKRQKEILTQAIKALKGGGRLVYSTCTYSIEENEAVVAWLLNTFPEMEQVDLSADFGRPGFAYEGMDPKKVRRIFPMDGGEGQFMAAFIKRGEKNQVPKEIKESRLDQSIEHFLQDHLTTWPSHILVKNNKIYGMDHPFLDFGRIKVLRQGWLLGEIKKNRIEPSQSLFLGASYKEAIKNKVELTLEEMDAFMHGEVLQKESSKGFVALCFANIPFGFGKSDGKRINNRLPKGLRLLPNSHIREVEYGK